MWWHHFNFNFMINKFILCHYYYTTRNKIGSVVCGLAVPLCCCTAGVPYYCTTAVVQLIENIFKTFFHRAHTTGDQFFHHRSALYLQATHPISNIRPALNGLQKWPKSPKSKLKIGEITAKIILFDFLFTSL